MNINLNLINSQYETALSQQGKSNLDHKVQNLDIKGDNLEELKKAVSEFTSILLQQMFKAMRQTIPGDGLLNGGFAEEVFTDMYDQEISRQGAKNQQFKKLNQMLLQQLIRKDNMI